MHKVSFVLPTNNVGVRNHSPCPFSFLLELLHKHGCKIFRHPQRLNGNTNRRHALRLFSSHGMLRHTLLHSHIIRILRKKVWHGRGILLRKCLHLHLIFVIRHIITEHLLVIRRDGCIRVGTPASIGGDTHLLTGLGLDGEFDLIEVGPFLARGASECLHAGELLVGRDAFDVFDRDVVEGDEEGEFVDGHVFEHTFGIAFEAFSKRFRGVLVGIVGDKSDM
mmetsp:Transcript_28519/g.49246  ORF Transcript_28519/g.49246 Transcript_28519/m.49246 type:complete len:222 (-) Transcript_28519:670-1335(-)